MLQAHGQQTVHEAGRSQLRRRRHRLRAGLAAVCLVGAALVPLVVLTASPAAAATVTPAQIVAPSGFLTEVACLDTTTCYAVGGIHAGPGVSAAAAIVPVTNGVAGTAQPLPPGYNLNDVVCTDGTTCVVYGSYLPPGSPRDVPATPVRLVITDGVVGAHEVIPHLLTIVGCATAAYCVGVTQVTVDTVAHGALVAITNGVHGTPQLFPDDVQSLEDIACPSANTCYAVGQTPPDPNFPDPIFGDPMNLGVVVPIVGGVIGTPELSPTLNTFFGVGCASPTTCYAVGPSNDIFSPTPLLVPIVNGIPGTPVPFEGVDVVTGIACMTATICEAVGFSSDAGVVVPVIDGVPGAPVPVPAANGLQGVACSVSNCVGIGSFNPPSAASVGVVTFITEPGPESTLTCLPDAGAPTQTCTVSDSDGVRTVVIRNTATNAQQDAEAFDCATAPTSTQFTLPVATRYKVFVTDCNTPREKTTFVIRTNGSVNQP